MAKDKKPEAEITVEAGTQPEEVIQTTKAGKLKEDVFMSRAQAQGIVNHYTVFPAKGGEPDSLKQAKKILESYK